VLDICISQIYSLNIVALFGHLSSQTHDSSSLCYVFGMGMCRFFFLQMFSCCYNGIVHPKKCKCCHHLL